MFYQVRAKEVSEGLEAVPPPWWTIAATKRVARRVQSEAVVAWTMSSHVAG